MKERILNEIKRTAKANNNKPLGSKRFSDLTGIKTSEWYGKAWNNWNSWGDAVKEAGFEGNKFQEAHSEDFLLKNLIVLIRKLKHFPIHVELRRESSINPDFPAHTVWTNRLGSKEKRIEAIVNFCLQTPDEYKDVLEICEPLLSEDILNDPTDFKDSENYGFVYLMKSGKHYKIGRTNALDRRQYEIGIQLPEKIQPVHNIRTDDPSGIEAYWHNRFKNKRMNGEWFNLEASDVRIFKKRKFM